MTAALRTYRVQVTCSHRPGDGASTGSTTEVKHVQARNAAHAWDVALHLLDVDETYVTSGHAALLADPIADRIIRNMAAFVGPDPDL